MRLPLVPESWYVLAHGDEAPVTELVDGMEYQNDVQQFNQCLITMPSPPTHKKNNIVGPQGKLMKELSKLYMKAPVIG
jgi:hypothetical protein